MAANHFSCMIKWDREMPLVTQHQIIEAFNLPAGGGILSVVIRRTTAYVRYQNDVAGYIAAAGVVQQNPTILGRATRVCKVLCEAPPNVGVPHCEICGMPGHTFSHCPQHPDARPPNYLNFD
ncbi:hypothetical protein M6B38_309180 [Iris pallida]|uniref:CCHC-type domain-containing protein n=1 Tax=Iris pallida TaxID=29817 RepID=A0AAX6HIS0_IRIPA|nr:hypothetical protein M6B38_309180 [Iris pallida]